MNFDEFIGQVQSRGRLSSLGDAVKATRAVLETLAERLPLDEVKDLAAQLPSEIAYYLRQRAAFRCTDRGPGIIRGKLNFA